MGEILIRRLKQLKPLRPEQDAILNLVVAANFLEDRMSQACAEFGISHQQHNILRILRGGPAEGYPCGEISIRMLDRAPDITRRLDGLEKMGLVMRERSAADRRVVLTSITQKGLEVLEKLTPVVESIDRDVRKKLTREECLELSRLCEKIYGGEE